MSCIKSIFGLKCPAKIKYALIASMVANFFLKSKKKTKGLKSWMGGVSINSIAVTKTFEGKRSLILFPIQMFP